MSNFDQFSWYSPWPLFGRTNLSSQWDEIRNNQEVLNPLARGLEFDLDSGKLKNSGLQGIAIGDKSKFLRFRIFYSKTDNEFTIQRNTGTDNNTTWVDTLTINEATGAVSISGSGEANTASNLGSGEGLATTKVGVDLPFKSLVEGTNITLSSSGTEITINSTATGGGDGGGFYGITVKHTDDSTVHRGVNVLAFNVDDFYLTQNPTNTDESVINFRGTAGGGVTAHSALTGLDADDHTQYILEDGTRAFSGDQSMGGNLLTNLGAPSADTDAARLQDIGPGFYGVTVKQTDDAAVFKGIEIIAFNADDFYVTQNAPNTDESIINFRGAATGPQGPTGATGPIGPAGGLFTQSFNNQVEWVVGHNLGTNDILVSAYDDNDHFIIPEKLDVSDPNTSYFYFLSPISGKAVVVFGSSNVVIPPGFYGITVKQTDDLQSFSGIEVLAFNSDDFYVTQNDPNTDEVIINFRGGTGGGVTDHGDLDGLGDDDHTQYALLDGRSGGQTLIGGTASGDDLVLESTSHATKGFVNFAAGSDINTLSTSFNLRAFGVSILEFSITAMTLHFLDLVVDSDTTITGNVMVGKKATLDGAVSGVTVDLRPTDFSTGSGNVRMIEWNSNITMNSIFTSVSLFNASGTITLASSPAGGFGGFLIVFQATITNSGNRSAFFIPFAHASNFLADTNIWTHNQGAFSTFLDLPTFNSTSGGSFNASANYTSFSSNITVNTVTFDLMTSYRVVSPIGTGIINTYRGLVIEQLDNAPVIDAEYIRVEGGPNTLNTTGSWHRPNWQFGALPTGEGGDGGFAGGDGVVGLANAFYIPTADGSNLNNGIVLYSRDIDPGPAPGHTTLGIEAEGSNILTDNQFYQISTKTVTVFINGNLVNLLAV